MIETERNSNKFVKRKNEEEKNSNWSLCVYFFLIQFISFVLTMLLILERSEMYIHILFDNACQNVFIFTSHSPIQGRRKNKSCIFFWCSRLKKQKKNTNQIKMKNISKVL